MSAEQISAMTQDELGIYGASLDVPDIPTHDDAADWNEYLNRVIEAATSGAALNRGNAADSHLRGSRVIDTGN